MLFAIYDVDGSGSLDYKEFSAAVFGRPMTGASRPATAQSSASANPRSMEALAEALQKKLASRGARGIIGLQR